MTLKSGDAGYVFENAWITAVALTQRGNNPEVVVERENGDLYILSATGDDFGRNIQTLVGNVLVPGGPIDPASCIEEAPKIQRIAVGRSANIDLYDLRDTESENLQPNNSFKIIDPKSSTSSKTSIIICKFLGSDIMAYSLTTSSEPLQWAHLRPSGIEVHSTPQYRDCLEVVGLRTEEPVSGEITTVHAIEPVGNHSSSNLILGAWDDGTFRRVLWTSVFVLNQVHDIC